MKKFFAIAALSAMAMVSNLSADTLTIQGTNLNLFYDSTNNTIYDATSALGGNGNTAQGDQVAGVTFTVLPGNILLNLGQAPFFIDTNLTLAGPIAQAGGNVAVTGGYFHLLNSTGWGLALNNVSGTITSSANGVSVNLGSGTGSLCGSCSPNNTFPIEGPFSVTFSSSNTTPATAGANGNLASQNILASFDVVGTAVPEPGTYAMLGSALLGLGLLRRRKA